MTHSTIVRVLGLTLPLALIACGRDKPAESATTTSYEDGPEAGMTPASGSVSEDEAARASGLGANPVESLNDAQVLAVASAINKAEVEQAEIAVDKAKNEAVKRFAETMIAHHKQAISDLDDYEDKVDLEPQESRLLAEFRVEAKSVEDKLDDAEDDASFDRLYMLSQVDAHRRALDTLDSRLIPNARSLELRQRLQTLRPRVASHLEMARAILNTL
jgi:putative membrane protein